MPAATFQLFSDTGAPLGELTTGRSLLPGPRITCDAPAGPVDFYLDRKLVHSEAAAPYALAGDVGGVIQPADIPPGAHTLAAVSWGTPVTSVVVQFTVLAPTPTPTPTPTPSPTPTPTPTPTPSMTWKIAPPIDKRGDGLSFIDRPGPVVLRDTGVRGFEQNLVVQNVKGLTLGNVVSLNAHKNPADTSTFKGQALYITDAGDVYVKGYAGLFSGWQQGMPPRQRVMYHHNLYGNWGCKSITFEDSIFWGAANAGAQARGYDHEPAPNEKYDPAHDIPVLFRRCSFIDNGNSFLPVAGYVTLVDSEIYGGHYYHQVEVRNGVARDVWTANSAISSYCALRFSGLLVLGRPGQDGPSFGEPAGDKRTPMGAIMGSRRYTDPHAGCSAGAKWSGSGTNILRGWPGANFSGDAPCPASMWKLDNRGPVAVPLDDLLAQLTAGSRPVVDVRAELSKRIRDAAA